MQVEPEVTDPAFWFVGASWDEDDQTARFIAEGLWQNGYDDRFLPEVRAMRPGERIALKSAFTQRRDLPFDAGGLAVSVMRIKAVGTITANRGDGKSVEVEWQEPQDRDWYFYTNRQTVWRVMPTSERARALIDFAFHGREQDYRWWLGRLEWRERRKADGFAWIPFYEAVADALEPWRDRRPQLAEVYHQALDSVGAAFSGDRNAEGKETPLSDMDPFTFIGLFNRAYTDERRRQVAARVASALGIDDQPPSSFDGIPRLNHARTRFFADTPERNKVTIGRLWEVWDAARALRNADDETIRARFVAAYDAALLSRGVSFNLSVGLFWMCPWRLPSLDRHTRALIERELHVELKDPPSGKRYLDIADRLRELLEKGEPFSSIPDLVQKAPPRPGAPEHSKQEIGPAPASPAPEAEEDEELAKERETHFVADDAEMERDGLGRGVLAIALAGQLHQIWRRANPPDADPCLPDDRAAFVVHVDAPWGGGKTSFAHFVSAVLNPASGPGGRAARFLEERYGKAHDFAELLVDADANADHRRPWITVWFNAWRAEHCSPPWWVFYQAIRKQCFSTLWREGDAAMRPGKSGGWRRRRSFLGPPVAAWLWLQEIGWRLWNPKVRGLIATTLLCFALVWALFEGHLLGIGDKAKVELLVQNGIGFGLGALGTVSFIWAAGAVFTESIMPGTDSWGEKLSLGTGDPFDRFRRHFRRMMEEVRRPVMVVVDDLDRCRPEFVVDLVRGMQTLLRSPRVVFVILGDREWIERSFETYHERMNDGEEALEQNFGARFVAKAIQMSFVLPEIDPDRQESYVETILLDGRVRPASGAQPMVTAASTAREALAATGVNASDQTVRAQAVVQGKPLPAGFDRALREERAIATTTSLEAERGIRHLLQSLAPCLPPNPRQIKRIINAVTMYHAVAYQNGLPVDEEGPALTLAAWIVLMSEWPESWRLLATWPELLDVLGAEDAAAEITRVEIPAIQDYRHELDRLARDERLLRLIRGDGKARPPLTAASIRQFLAMTPVYAKPRPVTAHAAVPPEH